MQRADGVCGKNNGFLLFNTSSVQEASSGT